MVKLKKALIPVFQEVLLLNFYNNVSFYFILSIFTWSTNETNRKMRPGETLQLGIT